MRDTLPTERIATAVYLLANGRRTTVRDLAAHLDITPRGARAMLEKLSRVLPLIDDGGVWRVLGDDDDQAGDA